MTETRISNQQDIEDDIARYADKLRAGLLDSDPAFKKRVEAVLAANPGAVRFWQHVRGALERSTAGDAGVGRELKARRHEVLQQAGRRKPQRALWPQLATATAFSVVLAVTATWLLGRHLPKPIMPVTEEVALSNGPELEELNANLDFYAWLDNQKSSAPDSH